MDGHSRSLNDWTCQRYERNRVAWRVSISQVLQPPAPAHRPRRPNPGRGILHSTKPAKSRMKMIRTIEPGGRVANDAPGPRGREHAVEHHAVKVQMRIERRPEAVDEGHRPESGRVRTLCLGQRFEPIGDFVEGFAAPLWPCRDTCRCIRAFHPPPPPSGFRGWNRSAGPSPVRPPAPGSRDGRAHVPSRLRRSSGIKRRRHSGLRRRPCVWRPALEADRERAALFTSNLLRGHSMATAVSFGTRSPSTAPAWPRRLFLAWAIA